jgi:hypothetical protein
MSALPQLEERGDAPAPVDVLRIRAWSRAALWAAGEIATIPEAVDELQAFAVASGLVEQIGQDAVQAILAEAFAPVRDDLRPADDDHLVIADDDDSDGAEVCDVCFWSPCMTPGFCNACRELDARADRRKPAPEERQRPTPQATIEALLWCVRERGLEALNEPANIERLSRCDDAARDQINQRIAKLFRDEAAE